MEYPRLVRTNMYCYTRYSSELARFPGETLGGEGIKVFVFP